MRVSRKKKLIILALSSALVSIPLISQRRRRRFGTRPFLKHNKKYNHFDKLVTYMLENDASEFFNYTRMSPEVFKYLLSLVENDLKRKKHNALKPAFKLVLTLHFLAEGLSMNEIARNFTIGKSTAHYIIRETCDIIWKRLMPIFLPYPKEENFNKIAEEFWKRWNIPNCVGAVDGKHVEIQAPFHSGTDYFSYKKSFSILLMAVCDSYYKFVMVDIGGQGSQHDSTIFKNSHFGNELLSGKLILPPTKALPNTNIELPHYIVGDQAFPLHENIMRPYPGENLSPKQIIYNYRLSRARRTIENTFGILVARWRILKKKITANVSTCENIVKACVVLHNFVQCSEESLPESERRYCPTGLVDKENENGDIIMGQWRQERNLTSVRKLGSNNYSRVAQKNRDMLCDFFNSSVGSLPFQENKILLGAVPI